MTLAEGAGAPNVLVDARYRAIESVIPRVIPVSATLSCTGGYIAIGGNNRTKVHQSCAGDLDYDPQDDIALTGITRGITDSIAR